MLSRSAAQGFEQFVLASLRPLSRTAYTLTGDKGAAEDLIQETHLRVARHWSRLSRQGADPLPYARRVLYRLWLDSVRWRRRRPETIGDVHDLAVSDGMDVVVAREVLRSAFSALPPRQRAVLVLRYLDERSEHETAEILECSVSNVQALARRALATLRQHDLIAEQSGRFETDGG